MKAKIIHIIAAIVLIFGFCVNASAEENSLEANGLSGYEVAFLDMINEARKNPLAVASSMGMDPDQILADFPELYDILTEGLPPLTFNENLHEAARVHTEDMLEEGYYAHDSLDGRTYDDRIRDVGYLPLLTGESLGLSGFSNFIDPAESVRTMFERMFRDQLDPAGGEQMNILDSELTHVGIAMGAGTLNLGGYTFNAYIITCDFGRSVEVAGMQLFQLINQARSRPLDVAASLGMDPEQVLSDLPELHDILTEGLPPLTFNLQLYTAARAHAEDMFKEEYYGHDSPDGRTYEDRIREAGYDPLASGESIGLQCLGSDFIGEPDDNLVDHLVSLMFRKIFACELAPDGDEERNILDPVLREVGISIITGTSSKLGGICGDNLLMMVADFGLSSTEQPHGIEGVVYSDLNQDNLYSPGEGIGRVSVSVEGLSDDDTSRRVDLYTNEAGGFSLPAVPGEYRISVVVDDHEMTRDIEVGEEENSVVMFSVCCGSEEADPSEIGQTE